MHSLQPMTQHDIDNAEWHNPANWHGGVLGVYYSRHDSRTIVPKPLHWLGATINFARPGAIAFVVCVVALGIIPVVFARRSRKR